MKSTDKYVLVLVAALALLLAGCGGGSSSTSTEPTPEDMTMERAEMQTADIMTASMAVNTALDGLSGSAPTQAQIDAADTAIGDLRAALAAAADVSDAEKAGYQAQMSDAQGTVTSAEATLMAMQDATAEKERKAMAAMASKLWAGIGMTPLMNNGEDTAIDTDDGALSVQRVTDPETDAVELAENKDAMVGSLHGWEGSEHTKKVTDAGTYTARLYSNVGDPMKGAKFNSGNGDGNVGFILTGDGAVVIGDAQNVPSRIVSPSFDQSAGVKRFTLPDPNTVGATKITPIQGSYYGVAGTYSCTPTGGGTDCSATKASEGYMLGGGTWEFTPGDDEARVTETPDTMYAVYGWWLHETASGTATVSAFADYRGTDTVAIGNLNGTATYKGGAAGKYAISAGTNNDSGHFTADAELKAEFNSTDGTGAHMISGTINNFMGSDGMSRDWSVALKKSTLSDAGAITSDGTTWTMDGTDAAESGKWVGMLYEEDESGVPGEGAGTFDSKYSNTGRMVGAFGVDLESN